MPTGIDALESFDLHGTKVTNVALPHFVNMQSLKEVNLIVAQVTQAGVDELEKARPGFRASFLRRQSDERLGRSMRCNPHEHRCPHIRRFHADPPQRS